MIRLVRDFDPMAKVEYAAMDLLAGQRTHSAYSLRYGGVQVDAGMTFIIPRYNLIVHMEEEARHAVPTHQNCFGSTSRVPKRCRRTPGSLKPRDLRAVPLGREGLCSRFEVVL
jgi:hypothetical protein